ncbi:MAG: DUF2490 domain-containing protein [Ignavibacteriae bacterium]|jgi:hypothetical protein|nr:DUF2490 domain-containing protein [Ignavibacteriota bacterium]
MKYVFLILFSFPMFIKAESIGNWMMYIGNNPISEKYSIWNEIQYRDRRVFGDFTQLIVRTGLNYALSNESQVLLGYAYIFADATESSFHEHRLFQQGIHRHAISSLGIQHRVRLEERFVEEKDMSVRFRYLLGATYPLNMHAMNTGAIYASAFNEIFVNMVGTAFDRNRIYGAIGYQWSPYIRTELGYMSQITSQTTQNQLQIAIFTNNPWF